MSVDVSLDYNNFCRSIEKKHRITDQSITYR